MTSLASRKRTVEGGNLFAGRPRRIPRQDDTRGSKVLEHLDSNIVIAGSETDDES
jgi:hypothetical protein